nr:hypothetical protein CFP56_07521 [Quercus suber]
MQLSGSSSSLPAAGCSCRQLGVSMSSVLWFWGSAGSSAGAGMFCYSCGDPPMSPAVKLELFRAWCSAQVLLAMEISEVLASRPAFALLYTRPFHVELGRPMRSTMRWRYNPGRRAWVVTRVPPRSWRVIPRQDADETCNGRLITAKEKKFRWDNGKSTPEGVGHGRGKWENLSARER